MIGQEGVVAYAYVASAVTEFKYFLTPIVLGSGPVVALKRILNMEL